MRFKQSFSFNVDTKLTEEKVKKSWTLVDAKTLKKEDVQKETVYCLDDDDETEVQKDDLVQGMGYSVCALLRHLGLNFRTCSPKSLKCI